MPMLWCEQHKCSRDTESNDLRTQLSMPNLMAQCGLYTLVAADLEKFPKVDDEAKVGMCNVKRLS